MNPTSCDGITYSINEVKSIHCLFFKGENQHREQDLQSMLTACKLGDSKAQRWLIRKYVGFVKNVSSRYAASREEMEEIVNDSFFKVFTNLHQFDLQQPFNPWLKKITINTAVDHYRRNIQWQQQTENLDKIDVPDLSVDTIGDISAEEILLVIQKLPPYSRIVFTLFVIEGFSHKEIATLLEIQEGTSKSNLRDARSKLRDLIKTDYPGLFEEYNAHTKGSDARRI